MVISEQKYKDCVVKRELVVSCGADWREHPGEERVVVSVLRKGSGPDGHDEILLPGDPLFREAAEATMS
jgi:hypothetical protein